MDIHYCSDCDTEGAIGGVCHVFPAVGERVRVLTSVVSRAPGDDTETPINVPAGAMGTVEGFVVDWHDVDVRLDDGTNVWICNDNLGTETWTPTYEIEGCVEHDDCIHVVQDKDAQFWTVYVRDEEGLAQALADFPSRKAAQEYADDMPSA